MKGNLNAFNPGIPNDYIGVLLAADEIVLESTADKCVVPGQNAT